MWCDSGTSGGECSSEAVQLDILNLMKGRLAGMLLCTALMGIFFSVPASFAFAETTPANTSANPQAETCSGENNYVLPGWMNSFHCVMRAAISNLGGMVVALAGWTLGIAGLLFNYLIDTTIVGFGKLYNESLINGVETGWAAFRDVANIAIIGAFVFVAISTILGSNSYGVRQFLARILIAAILINFSIFFAKFSIDVSHIVASQFDKAIDSGRPTAGSIGVTAEIDSPPGIAGSFFSSMKITSAWKSDLVIEKVAQNSGLASAFIYVILVATLFYAAAIVLLYGAFLLVVRIVMLMFLLLVSALAFGSMAIPGFTSWWDKWLEEFLKNVLFGPLLIMFLWATLTVANTLSNTSGSLTDLISKPGSTVGIAVLLNYLIVLGLLYGSIKIAQSLSVTGANKLPSWQKTLRYATLNPAKLAAGTLGFAARQSIGRGADKLKGRYGESWQNAANKEGAAGIERRAARFALKATDGMRNASFNANRIPAVMKDIQSNLSKQFNMKSDGKGGFAAGQEYNDKMKKEREQKAIAEAAKSAAPSGKEKKEGFQKEAYATEERKKYDEEKRRADGLEKSKDRDKWVAELKRYKEKEASGPLNTIDQTEHDKLAAQLNTRDEVIKSAKAAAQTARQNYDNKRNAFNPGDSAHVEAVNTVLKDAEKAADAFKAAGEAAKKTSDTRLAEKLTKIAQTKPSFVQRLRGAEPKQDEYRKQELLSQYRLGEKKKEKAAELESLGTKLDKLGEAKK